jgi:hypothetical protein
MTQIRTLFDAGKDIQRAIEKVITYQASQERIHPARDAVGERWPAGPAHRF